MEPSISIKEPAFLLVHGGFHLPETYAPFLYQVSKAGFVVRCPRLPTNGDVRPPKAKFQDDVAIVRTVALELAGAGHMIVVLAHSYGGLVTSEAITEDLYAKHGNAGVVRLIYLSAWMIQPGTSLTQLFKKYGFQCKLELEKNEDGTARAKNAPEALYNDLGDEEAQQLSKKLVTHNLSETSTTITHAPWKDIPTFFVYCTQDMGIYLDLQKSMVKDAVEGGAAELNVRTLESSHSPFWSMPAAVVGIVVDIWESYEEGSASR